MDAADAHAVGLSANPLDNPEPAQNLLFVRSADGRLEIFVASVDGAGNVWHAYQLTPNGGWSDWSQLGDPRGSSIGRPLRRAERRRTSGSVRHDLLLICGKYGDIFLLNRQELGGYAGPGENKP